MPMRTVVITDRRTTPLFATHRRLFAPFLAERGGDIRHCTWHEASSEIEQAVPELYESIRGYPDWRAIVFVNPRQGGAMRHDPKNPFDFDCNREGATLIRENPSPLVRLTHMLAGFHSLGVKEYKTGCAYFNEVKNTFSECLDKNGELMTQGELESLGKEECERLFEGYAGNVKPRLIGSVSRAEQTLGRNFSTITS